MNRSLSFPAVIACLLVAPLLEPPKSGFCLSPTSEPQLTIRVFNYAGLSASQVQRVGAVVTAILGKTSIQARWLDCRPASLEIPTPAPCVEPLGSADLVMRLSDQTAVAGPDSLGLPLAHALATEQRGALATVFCGSVKSNSPGVWASRIQLLGYAATHEIGHLLLGSKAHTKEGIMRACWDKQDKLRMATFNLLFTREQRELLQQNITARLNPGSSQSSALDNQ